MKNVNQLILIICLLINSISYSQINVGSNEIVQFNPGKFDPEDLEKLKASKTLFVYRETDNIQELKKAIQEVWTLTEISFIPHSDLTKKDFQNASIFSISGFNTVYKPFNRTYDNTHVYLSLWMNVENAKGKKVSKTFCRIELHPTPKDYHAISDMNDNKVMDYLYTSAKLENWNSGFLKNYLQLVNDHLKTGTTRWLFLGDKKPELKSLTTATLYVPDYILTKFEAFKKEHKNTLDKEEIFGDHPYKYEIVSANDLSNKIMTSEAPIYYLTYVKSGTDLFLSIVNSRTGSIVYSSYKPSSYNVSSLHFKLIASAIKSQSEK